MTDTDAPADGGNTDTTQPSADTASQQPAEQPTDAESTQDDDRDYRKLYEQAVAQSRKWESRARENRDKAKKWDEAEEANRTEAERSAARAEQAEARAKSAIIAAVNAEIRAAALGWATPADAPRYIDDKQRYIGEDGEIDVAMIAEDVAAVLKERPHLAAVNSRRGPAPDPGQGHRGGLSVADQIREAERRGDHREALRLKTAQLLDHAKSSR
ncbi:hypothetical protein [Amycolatopsis sp. NPDC059021]|uniref:hypothetical protein n=1 Tax=Amycolatopsis sp. NPDC059021 TaxID=3346704 RepID=UPI00367222AB